VRSGQRLAKGLIAWPSCPDFHVRRRRRRSRDCQLCAARLDSIDRRPLLGLAQRATLEDLQAHTFVEVTYSASMSIVLMRPQDSMEAIMMAVRLLIHERSDNWFTVLGSYRHPDLAGVVAESPTTLLSCLQALRMGRSVFVVANDVTPQKTMPWTRLAASVDSRPNVAVMTVDAAVSRGRPAYYCRFERLSNGTG
jgi:hypothetical protein